MVVFHSYVSLPEGNILNSFPDVFPVFLAASGYITYNDLIFKVVFIQNNRWRAHQKMARCCFDLKPKPNRFVWTWSWYIPQISINHPCPHWDTAILGISDAQNDRLRQSAFRSKTRTLRQGFRTKNLQKCAVFASTSWRVQDMLVSYTGGTPEWMVCNGKSI